MYQWGLPQPIYIKAYLLASAAPDTSATPPIVLISKDGGDYNAVDISGGGVLAQKGSTNKWTYTPTATECQCGCIDLDITRALSFFASSPVYLEADYTSALATNIGTTNSSVAGWVATGITISVTSLLAFWNSLTAATYLTDSFGLLLKTWVPGKVLGYDTALSPSDALTDYGVATATNVTDAQGVVTTAISNIPAIDIGARLTAFGVATTTDVTDAQGIITDTITATIPDIDARLTAYGAAKTTDMASITTTINAMAIALRGPSN